MRAQVKQFVLEGGDVRGAVFQQENLLSGVAPAGGVKVYEIGLEIPKDGRCVSRKEFLVPEHSVANAQECEILLHGVEQRSVTLVVKDLSHGTCKGPAVNAKAACEVRDAPLRTGNPRGGFRLAQCRVRGAALLRRQP